MRNPLLLELDKPGNYMLSLGTQGDKWILIDVIPSDALNDVLAVEGREAGPLGGDVHPGHVVHGAEHADLVVDAAVGLHALEQLLGVVQNLKGEDGS